VPHIAEITSPTRQWRSTPRTLAARVFGALLSWCYSINVRTSFEPDNPRGFLHIAASLSLKL